LRHIAPDRRSRSILGYVQDRPQDAKANGTTAEDKPKTRTRPTTTRNTRQQKSKRFERQNGATEPAAQTVDTDLSPKALLTRLEQQSGQLGILRSKLDEARQALEQERESAKADREALTEERRNRERLETTLKREQAARKQAEGTLDESRATATALEAQHHLLRAQLKALEHKGRRGLLRRHR
jgi:chromosome segregation ATPase